MRKLICLALALTGFTLHGQCDLAITDFNFTTGDIVVEVINSENCGCNELTDIETTCNTSPSPTVQNNETVSHIVLGLHAPGYDYNWGCTTTNNHPGWTFKAKSFFGNSVLETGDTWNANIYDFSSLSNDCWSEILANEEMCTELVIWQINLSQTSTVEDGGWAVNPNVANQTQNYPDFNIWNNSTLQCPIECEPDTIIEYVDNFIIDTVYINLIDTVYINLIDTVYINLIDTVYITETVYEIDTLYITQTFIDTVYLTETIYLTDTLYFTEYIIDTVTQYIVEEVLIDCETGLPCNEDPGYPCFGEGSIYVPNTFTPNNDGINDVWKLVYELDCYMDIEFWIFNRWGNEIFHAYGEDYESYPYWDGSVNGGSHYVSDGIYIYKLKGRKAESPTIIEETGHITIFR